MATIQANVPVIYLREGDTFLVYTPALDLCAHGDSLEDAKKSFETSVELFFEEVVKHNTVNQVFREYGWKEKKRKWMPPIIIGQHSQPVEIPVSA